MIYVRYNKLLRIGKRGLQLAQAQELPVEVGAIAPLVVDAYQGFFRSFEELRSSADAERSQHLELEAALARLRREYDVARVALLAWSATESIGRPGSHCRIPEDLLEASREAHQLLSARQEPCAKLFLPAFTQALERAEQECRHGIEARISLQKTQTQCREDAGLLEMALVMLRRLVRVLYGSSSREYQMLRMAHFNDADNDSTGTPVPLPADSDQTPKQNAA